MRFDALKAHIESHALFADAIAPGKVHYQCSAISRAYSHQWTQEGIDHVALDTMDHSMLAVKTSDRGIVIFDPTIRQFDKNYPQPYFLGSVGALKAWIDQQGGMDTPILHYAHLDYSSTARSLFIRSRITAPLCPKYGERARQSAYMNEWLSALEELAPTSQISTLSMKPLRVAALQ